MDHMKSKNVVVVRLDEGDEIIDCLKRVCKKEKIKSALVNGVGGASAADIGHYHTKTKKYHRRRFEGMLEIVSLMGNITIHQGEAKPHLHAVLGTHNFTTVAGHLMHARVNPTCELLLIPFKTKMERKHDSRHELNLLRF